MLLKINISFQMKEFSDTLRNKDPDTLSAIERLIENREEPLRIEVLLFKLQFGADLFTEN